MNPFQSLTPERVLDLTEAVLGCRTQSLCRPLTSYINRVFELSLSDGRAVVAKFFRPGRWSVDALEDEQEFVFELAQAGLPVVAPLCDAAGDSLFCTRDGIWFALYPRKRGRPFEDPTPADWQELGRTLARMHLVGDQLQPVDRLHWHPETATREHLHLIRRHAPGDANARNAYHRCAEALIEQIADRFDFAETTCLHGDMHIANLMRRPGEDGLFLIDFDDMCLGTPAQDLWMLLPGRFPDCPREVGAFLYGYRQFRDFPLRDLDLIEPLRAMRLIHFTAWCALQHHDGEQHPLAHDVGRPAWWRETLNTLQDQLAHICEET